MAIVEFINQPNRSYTGMSRVLNYVMNPEKTHDELVSGIVINPKNAYREMVTLKQLMGKTDRRLWYHFVQSFAPYDSVTPELAHKIAIETAEYFKGQYQIVIVTHIDKTHIHTHFVLNTVNIETGRKYTQNNSQRLEIQALSDSICNKHGLSVLSQWQREKRTYKKPGQYRSERKGSSWKAELKNTIDKCLMISSSRDEFIENMMVYGYYVNWSDTRKNITFTTPNGKKCRDKTLGEPEIYNKQYFEMVFEQNTRQSQHGTYGYQQAETLLHILSGAYDNDGTLPVEDGFMQGDGIDFHGLSKIEIEIILARQRTEKLIKQARIAANQSKHEQAAAQQTMQRRLDLLEQLVQILLSRTYENETDFDEENELEF